jgi:uncharacterized membrane protein
MGSIGRHFRFLMALCTGLALGVALQGSQGLAVVQSVILGFDSFALLYLGLSLWRIQGLTAQDLRRHSEDQDEGMVLIPLLAAAAVGVSFWAIAAVLNGQDDGWPLTACALIAVPLGWAIVQMLAGFHYAHLQYLPGSGRPLHFPGDANPGPWDFMYFAFTIGMTAQVSDVVITTTRLRRAVLLHSVLSFFYNTILLALAVNASLKLI